MTLTPKKAIIAVALILVTAGTLVALHASATEPQSRRSLRDVLNAYVGQEVSVNPRDGANTIVLERVEIDHVLIRSWYMSDSVRTDSVRNWIIPFRQIKALTLSVQRVDLDSSDRLVIDQVRNPS